MRIAVVVFQFPKVSETFVLNQICGLIQAGHQVEIYAYKKGSGADLSQNAVTGFKLEERTFYFPRQNTKSYQKALALLFTIITRGYKTPMAVLWLIRYSLSQIIRGQKPGIYNCDAFIGQRPYDVVHFQFGNLVQDMIGIRKFPILNGKWLVSFRGYDITRYLKERGRKVFNETFQAVDRVLPVSDNFKSRLIDLGCDEEKITVLRSGIDINRFKFRNALPQNNNPVQLLSYCRLVQKKGLEYAVRAVARLVEEGLPIVYTIIGSGPLREEIGELIIKHGKEKHILLLEDMNQDLIIEKLSETHIFLCPSVTADNGDEEGIPNSLKEAMAVGVPVIATYHSGIPELVENDISGCLINERDELALAEKIKELMGSSQKQLQLGRCGRQKIEQEYNIEKWNAELLKLYRNHH